MSNEIKVYKVINGEIIFDVGDNWISVLSEERFILHDKIWKIYMNLGER